MNFKIIDEHGRQLEMGRNLASSAGRVGQPGARKLPEDGGGHAGRRAQQCRHACRLGQRKRRGADRRACAAGQGEGRSRGRAGCTAGRQPAHQSHQLDLRPAAGAIGDQPGQADPDRLPGPGRQGHALRSGSVRRPERGGAHPPHRPAPPVRAAAEGSAEIRREEHPRFAGDGHAVHDGRLAGRAARPDRAEGDRHRLPAGSAADGRRVVQQAQG